MSDEELDRLQKLCDDASADVYVAYPTCGGLSWNVAGPKSLSPSSEEFLEQDAKLMAESRTAMPLLIAEVRRLRTERARLTAKCDQQQRDIMDLRTELARSVI